MYILYICTLGQKHTGNKSARMKLPAGERIETSVYKVGRVRADAPDVDRVALDPPETKTRQRGQRKKGINSAKRIS